MPAKKTITSFQYLEEAEKDLWRAKPIKASLGPANNKIIAKPIKAYRQFKKSFQIMGTAVV
jgi:hypothetical protein